MMGFLGGGDSLHFAMSFHTSPQYYIVLYLGMRGGVNAQMCVWCTVTLTLQAAASVH